MVQIGVQNKLIKTVLITIVIAVLSLVSAPSVLAAGALSIKLAGTQESNVLATTASTSVEEAEEEISAEDLWAIYVTQKSKNKNKSGNTVSLAGADIIFTYELLLRIAEYVSSDEFIEKSYTLTLNELRALKQLQLEIAAFESNRFN